MTNAIKRAGRAAMWEVMKDRSPEHPHKPLPLPTAANATPATFLQMLANDKLLKIDTETGKFKRP
jgi:hypothetical protein